MDIIDISELKDNKFSGYLQMTKRLTYKEIKLPQYIWKNFPWEYRGHIHHLILKISNSNLQLIIVFGVTLEKNSYNVFFPPRNSSMSSCYILHYIFLCCCFFLSLFLSLQSEAALLRRW